MTRDWEAPDAERELLGRPFVDRASRPHGWTWSPVDQPPAPDPAHSPADPTRPHDDVRPYLMTGGRTETAGPPVAMETVIVLSGLARRGPIPRQAFERARILRECQHPCSVAEVAARLQLPLGVAAVLVADLLADGLLDASMVRREQAHDIELLERLIAGVSAL
ncbi:MAG TPA: DUF742 domain-containing protein [Kineosporiaceae bacterium]|nr:DUF742 domain-containing protein [Kineosporiaceae bacterium]